jgi:hypothetical protein
MEEDIPEDALEEWCDAVADGAARAALPSGLGDQAALDERRDGRVGCDTADPCDLGTRDRAEVRDDRKRLERSLAEPTLDGPLEQPAARLRGLARRTECGATGHPLEHDPTPPFTVAVAEEPERRLDPLRVVLGRLRELCHRKRLRGDDEQRFHGTREGIDGIRRDQAERAVHVRILSFSVLATRIGANGAL